MHLNATWLPEHIEKLEALHKDGLSASQIGRMINKVFGTTYSRNAVIGKLHRLGLCGGESGDEKRRNSGTDGALAWRLTSLQARGELGKRHKDVSLSDTENPTTTIDKATSNQCRWPCGKPSPDMPICGQPTLPGQSYCQKHYDLAYTPVGAVNLNGSGASLSFVPGGLNLTRCVIDEEVA